MNNSHDLIKRSQTFALERKCISIHSEDRDMSKYKNSNSFEVTLPETLRNVQTMCLAEICLPTNLYIFCNNYQNTKFKFSLSPSLMMESLSSEYNILKDFYSQDNNKFTAEITSGSYTPQTFASEVQMQMNNVVTDFIKDNIQDIPASGCLGFSGTGKIGTTVTADTSDISDPDSDDSALAYDYQWQISNDKTTWSKIVGFNINTSQVLHTIADNNTALGSVSVTEGVTVTWSIIDNTDADVTISNAGEISLQNGADYQNKKSYFFTVQAENTSPGMITTAAIAINVTNPNPEPATINSENVANTPIDNGETALGSVSTTTENVTWSVVDSTSEITISSAGVLTLTYPADYEINSSHSFTVKATTLDNNYVTTKALVVNVTNPNSEIAIDGSNVNATIDNKVKSLGTVSVGEDVDVTWSIVETETGVSISNNGTLSLDSPSDYQTQRSYFFTVKAKKNLHEENTLAFAINVNNNDNNPAIIDSTGVIQPTIDEGETDLGSVSATDGNGNINVNWSITDQHSDVTISDSGKLSLRIAADYETKSSYSFSVHATTQDGNAYVTTKAFAVNVNHTYSSTNSSYTIPNDIDLSSSKYIRLQVESTDSNESTTTLYSGYTEIIPDDSTPPLVTGVLAFKYETNKLILRADHSSISFEGTSTHSYDYQWQQSSDATHFVPISGAKDAHFDVKEYSEVMKDYNFIRLMTTIRYKPAGQTSDSHVTKVSGYVNILHHVYDYNNFNVHFDSISQELYIGNTRDEFKLNFDIQCDYDDICSSGQPEMWGKSINWGLPYNMGFEQEQYTDYTSTRTGIQFSSMSDPWLLPDSSSSPTGTIVKSCYYVSPFPIQILFDDTIYMEMEKYNTMDELLPYSFLSAGLLNSAKCSCMGQMGNAYGTASANKICSQNKCPKCQVCPTPYSNVGGKVNSAFAKIPYGLSPISPTGANYQRVAIKGEIQNVSSFAPPLDSVSKLKMKFRFHDGRLVEFGKFRFDFTLAIGLLTDEISRSYDTRVPSEYYM